MIRDMGEKVYLEDGMYVENDGWSIRITSEADGDAPAEILDLEPPALKALYLYVRRHLEEEPI